MYIDSDVEGFETISVNYGKETIYPSTSDCAKNLNIGTDIPNLKGNHKRYLYGPGSILVAHSDHEHLKLLDLLAAVEGYKRIVMHALRLEQVHES